ncbi:MAG: Ig-like domain-containing protein, partial [Thermoproteota archaeon]|nr:Ig-like domain-containing protein [Thermoproteota archaeon]
ICPAGHSEAFCSAYNGAAGSSTTNTPPGSSTQGSTAHCDAPGYPSCYSLGYADGKNHPGTTCPSGHSQNYCNGYRAGAGISVSSNNTTGSSLQADVAHCGQVGWPSCYSVGFQDGKAHPGTPCPGGHSADFCSGWNAGAGNTSHCGRAGYPSCYSVGYDDGLQHLGASCPNGHTPNYCAGWNAAAGNTAHCDQAGWSSCYDVGYIAGKNALGSSCPPGHSKAFCNGYATGAGTMPLLDTHCDTSGYPSCYSLGYQAGKNAPGTPCPSGHTLNYCSGWEVGNRSTVPLLGKLSVSDASYKTAQNTAIDITLKAQDTNPVAKVTISVVSQPTHGSLKATGSANQYRYTPIPGFSGTDSFQYAASDNNGSKSNVGTISIAVGSPSQTKLSVSIVIAKNPIVRGNIQTITVTVGDDTGRKVAGASLQGVVLYASGYPHTFSGITNNLGQMIHSWRISGDAIPGQFKVTVDATATGYDKGSATKLFTVIPRPGA